MAVRTPTVRRTVQTLITNYRAARRARDPEEIQTASLELGAALERTGILAEIGSDNMTVTLWQPVATEGGPPGFATQNFRNTGAVPAPAWRIGKTMTAKPKTAMRRQLQPA